MQHVASEPVVLSSFIISEGKTSIPEFHNSNMFEVTSFNNTLCTSINLESSENKLIKIYRFLSIFIKCEDKNIKME